MLKLVPLLTLMLLFASPQNPHDPDNPDAPPNPELQRQEIVNLEHETVRAIMLHNATFFRRVYSDDYHGTFSHAQAVNKQQLLDEVQNGGGQFSTFNASDINVRLFQDTAIATCLWTSRGSYRGQQIETQMRVMHIYVNGQRGWKVVAGQATQLAPYTPHPL
ncbi:MAG: nuclear transport factor 2 family protein [Acidobacteriota bacterium]|nr:nuclear transport factor 2 family protein [Acidobacteriota bacterium]